MLLFLANLQAGQVGIFELKVIFLLEILCHCALHSLSTLQLQGKPVGRTAFNPTSLFSTIVKSLRLCFILPNLFEHCYSWENKQYRVAEERPKI
jgi:hypothetical protein